MNPISHFDICFKCHRRKPLTSFYCHSEMSNGHLGKCKKCTRKDVIENRNKHLSYYRKYDFKRSKLPHRLALREKVTQQWKKEHPGGNRAHTKVNNAIRDNRMLKPKRCAQCRMFKRLHAHHADYRKPLSVKWLCAVCHKAEHQRLRLVA